MSKRRRKLILLVCAILALALVRTVLHDREPSYQGRTLSQWVDEMPKAGVWRSSEKTAIRAIGTNAIPLSLKWISYEPSLLRSKIEALINRLPPRMSDRFISYREQRADRAVNVFDILGSEARTAIPELTRLAQTSSDYQRADRCVTALTHLGQEALPGVLTLVTNSPPHTRRSAVSALPSFGTNAAQAVPTLVQLMHDTNLGLAIQAVETVSELRVDDSIAFLALTNALQSRSALVRERAVYCLLRVQAPVSEAVPAILPMLTDPNYEVRATATNVSRQIAPEVFTSPTAN